MLKSWLRGEAPEPASRFGGRPGAFFAIGEGLENHRIEGPEEPRKWRHADQVASARPGRHQSENAKEIADRVSRAQKVFSRALHGGW